MSVHAHQSCCQQQQTLTCIGLVLGRLAPPRKEMEPRAYVPNEQETVNLGHVTAGSSDDCVGVKKMCKPRENLVLEGKLAAENDVAR